jgi:prepilin-type processing-associated H-X9-DG protein
MNMNFNGTVNNDTAGPRYDLHGEFGTTADPIWIGTLRNRKSVMWGCPTWAGATAAGVQYEYGSNNGYAMNIFPMAPDDIDTSLVYGITPKKTVAIRTGAFQETPFVGQYYRMTSWRAPGDRALIFDGVHNGGFFAYKWWNTASTPPTDGTGYDVLNASVTLPVNPNQNYPIDWNRHSKAKSGKVKASDLTFNMLFCDGHASTVSAREAYKAIRFR